MCKLQTVTQFCEANPAFTVRVMRWITFRSKDKTDPNYSRFAPAIHRIGRRVFIEIGTPIQDESALASADGSYRNMLRGWLRGVLYGHIEAAGTDATLARELADRLQSDFEQPFMSEPLSVLIINSDADEIADGRP